VSSTSRREKEKENGGKACLKMLVEEKEIILTGKNMSSSCDDGK